MLDYEKAIQKLEGQRRHSKKVQGYDHLPMISEKGEPAFGRITTVPQTSQISGDGALGDRQAEFQKFPVNPRRSPSGVFNCHGADQSSNLLIHLRPAAAPPRSPPPIQAKACPMPSDYRFGFHDDQSIRPARPAIPQSGPEQAVEAGQSGSRPLSFEHGDLLPCARISKEESARLRKNTRMVASDQREHESTVVTSQGASAAQGRPQICKLLI